MHNLEHGGIFIQYGKDVPQATVERAAGLLRQATNGTLLAPLPSLGSKIALGVWTTSSPSKPDTGTAYLAKCTTFDEKAYAAFFDGVPVPGPGALPDGLAHARLVAAGDGSPASSSAAGDRLRLVRLPLHSVDLPGWRNWSYAPDLKSGGLRAVWVRLPAPASLFQAAPSCCGDGGRAGTRGAGNAVGDTLAFPAGEFDDEATHSAVAPILRLGPFEYIPTTHEPQTVRALRQDRPRKGFRHRVDDLLFVAASDTGEGRQPGTPAARGDRATTFGSRGGRSERVAQALRTVSHAAPEQGSRPRAESESGAGSGYNPGQRVPPRGWNLRGRGIHLTRGRYEMNPTTRFGRSGAHGFTEATARGLRSVARLIVSTLTARSGTCICGLRGCRMTWRCCSLQPLPARAIKLSARGTRASPAATLDGRRCDGCLTSSANYPKMVKTSTPGVYKRGNAYQVVYRDPTGEQRKRSARTLAEARALKASLHGGHVIAGEYFAESKLTFADYARQWITSYGGRTARGLREGTRDGYRAVLGLDAEGEPTGGGAVAYFGRRPLVSIRPPDLREYGEALAAAGGGAEHDPFGVGSGEGDARDGV